MSLLSLRPSSLPFPPLLFLLFSPPKEWSHWKTWVHARPLYPSQPSRIRAHMHEQTHGSVRGIRPRHHLANEPWKLVPVNLVNLHDPPTVAARWHCVSSYFHTQKREKRREWEALLPNWLGLQARSGKRSDPDAVKLSSRPRFSAERKEQRTGTDSKLGQLLFISSDKSCTHCTSFSSRTSCIPLLGMAGLIAWVKGNYTVMIYYD